MDCPLLRFKNGFVDITVQKPQREQPLEVWSTSSSELGIFVTKNILGGRRRRSKLWTPHDRRPSRVQKRHTSSQLAARHPQVHCVANLPLRTEEKGLSYLSRFSIILNLRTMRQAWPYATTVQVHLGEMATLLGYGGQSCRTAVISLNYGVFFQIINISFE